MHAHDLAAKTTKTTFIRECEITDGELGECMYMFTEEDTQEVGAFQTELEINFENGVRLSVDNPITLTITTEQICQHNRRRAF